MARTGGNFLIHMRLTVSILASQRSQWYALAPSNKLPLTYCSNDSNRLCWFLISMLNVKKLSSREYLQEIMVDKIYPVLFFSSFQKKKKDKEDMGFLIKKKRKIV